MNPILADIYSTVIPSAPYVLAAYVLLWAVLFIFVLVVMKNLRKAENSLALLEETLDEKANDPSLPQSPRQS